MMQVRVRIGLQFFFFDPPNWFTEAALIVVAGARYGQFKFICRTNNHHIQKESGCNHSSPEYGIYIYCVKVM